MTRYHSPSDNRGMHELACGHVFTFVMEPSEPVGTILPVGRLLSGSYEVDRLLVTDNLF